MYCIKKMSSYKVSPKVAQASGKIAQSAKQVSGKSWFKTFLLIIVLLVLPLFMTLIAIRSVEIAKKPIDASTHPKIKEVHDRHLVGIIVAYGLYSTFLIICYVMNDYVQTIKFFMWIFIVINLGFAFSMMVIASDAINKIKEGGKTAEYKNYNELMIVITTFSVVIVFVMLVWAFVGKTAAKPQSSQKLKVQ